MNRKTDIKKFIVSTFLFGNDNGLREDTSFLESGVVDSTGILELVMHLEETYGIRISQEEMLPENLDSIDNIDQFIAKKTAKTQPVH